ncbi:hypothetical protein O9929_16400 [Vibrio lentus]|nr:hypothetical protein [Vibrio lentus]
MGQLLGRPRQHYRCILSLFYMLDAYSFGSILSVLAVALIIVFFVTTLARLRLYRYRDGTLTAVVN